MPDGTTHIFPAEATDEMIAAALGLSGEPDKVSSRSLSDIAAGRPAESGYNPLAAQIGGGIGMVKRAGETVYNIGNLARRIANVPLSVVGANLPQVPVPEMLKPATENQRLGGIGFDIASAAVPLAAGSRAIASAASALPKAAQIPARMAGEAALSGGVSAVQGGDPKTAAAIGAAIPVVGAAVSRLSPALRAAAEKKVTQALGATKEKFKAIAAARAPEILKRGLSGSRQTLLADATENARAAGKAVDAVLTQKGAQVVPVGSVIEALEQAKAGYQLSRKIPLAEAVRTGAANRPGAIVVGDMVELPIVVDARPIKYLTQLQGMLQNLGDEATVDQVVAVRRAWDQVVSQAGGYAHRAGGAAFGVPLREQTEAWAKKQATTAIRKMLAEEIPDLTAVNKEFAFWKDLKDVLKATEARTQAQGPGLSRVVTAGVGAAAGAASGDLSTAILSGIVAPKVYQVLTSANWRLVDARLRNALADAIASGNKQQITGVIARIGAVSAGKAASSGTVETPGVRR